MHPSPQQFGAPVPQPPVFLAPPNTLVSFRNAQGTVAFFQPTVEQWNATNRPLPQFVGVYGRGFYPMTEQFEVNPAAPLIGVRPQPAPLGASAPSQEWPKDKGSETGEQETAMPEAGGSFSGIDDARVLAVMETPMHEMASRRYSVEEYRQLLKLALTDYGKWEEIAVKLGGRPRRTARQVRISITRMHDRLLRVLIAIRTPEDVDALPRMFFQWQWSRDAVNSIRAEFLAACIKRAHGRMWNGRRQI
jgi:hypothetical protein